MSCESCTYSDDWKQKVDEQLDQRREDSIRSDERTKMIMDISNDTKSAVNRLEKNMNKLMTDMAVNNRDTARNTGVLDQLSVGKIVAFFIGLLTLMAYWKG